MSEIVGTLQVKLLEIVNRYFSEFPNRFGHMLQSKIKSAVGVFSQNDQL